MTLTDSEVAAMMAGLSGPGLPDSTTVPREPIGAAEPVPASPEGAPSTTAAASTLLVPGASLAPGGLESELVTAVSAAIRDVLRSRGL